MPFLSFLSYLALLHAATALLHLFDASPKLLPYNSPLFRWDALHFTHIASAGYIYEHEWAFFPAIAFLLRAFGLQNAHSVILFYALMLIVAWDTHRTLRSLSLHHLRSSKLTKLACTLSLIPTSPATLYFAPYNEPFFTYFSYRGMLFCTRREYFKAAICFALAGSFRSNGILLSGFLLWDLLIQPFLEEKSLKSKSLLKATAYTSVVFLPFVAHHIVAYHTFCSADKAETPAWCSQIPPSIYTHVQSKYWDNGFLRYWTLNQLPNFILAAPNITLLFAFSVHHLASRLRSGSVSFFKSAAAPSKTNLPFENSSITPHAIHALVMTFLLVFTSNVQIVLRLAASMPIIYWAAAWLLVEHPKAGRVWVIWSVLWGTISTILWATFLPPA
ncbi:hypothetical protein CPC08DRAFT_662669 [Agrocybe pediades]|nr:hypothetical protein CPC08DRAFT_662669 [Agrocybe pediades]